MTKSHLSPTKPFSNVNATNMASAGQQLLPEAADAEELRGILDNETPLAKDQKYFLSWEEEPKFGQKESWLHYWCFYQHNKEQKVFTHEASCYNSSSWVRPFLQRAASDSTLLISVGFMGPRHPVFHNTLIKKLALH